MKPKYFNNRKITILKDDGYPSKRADKHLHQGRRKILIDHLRQKGIHDERVLKVMEMIPRHYFMDAEFEHFAYEDRPFSIGMGQTISQPYTVAFQTQLLDLEPGMKVLEIGTGSGYQAAVLFLLGAKVHSIERQQTLYKKTTALLKELGLDGIKLILGDGNEGNAVAAPYDRIIVTAGASEVPFPLMKQLSIGGKMVIPVDHPSGQRQIMKVVLRQDEASWIEREHGNFQFVPLLNGINN